MSLFGKVGGGVSELQDLRGQIAAIQKSQAVIEFELDGTILTANENFLKTVGYSLAEIKGQHHRMFVDPVERQSADYKRFWERLGRGEYDAGQYKRIAKGGREVWIQASYNAVLDGKGRPFKVVKYATDITEQKIRNADFEGQLAAIGKSQAVIEFKLDGTILIANENFLKTLGYTLDEVKGRHHSMFVEPGYRQSAEYKKFWEKLGRGEYDAGQYQRIGKGGKEIWIQASYNPILDMNGKPFKVVKYATDVTAQVMAVQQTQGAVTAAKNNDLTQRIPLEGKTGDIALLCGGVNDLLDTVSTVIGDFKSAAREVASASSEISTSTTDLSQRTEEQAASLEETTASMARISETVKKNADDAQQASQFAENTRAVADRGGKVVTEAVSAMARIAESSGKISDIISVIDEIARQTQMDEVTQQNSALVEENAATAKTLEQQSALMNDRVAAFKLDRSSAADEGHQPSPTEFRRPAAKAARPERAAPVRPARRAVAGGRAQAAVGWQEF